MNEVYILTRVTSPREDDIDGVALAKYIEQVIPGPTTLISVTAAVVEPRVADRPPLALKDGTVRVLLKTTIGAYRRLFPTGRNPR